MSHTKVGTYGLPSYRCGAESAVRVNCGRSVDACGGDVQHTARYAADN